MSVTAEIRLSFAEARVLQIVNAYGPARAGAIAEKRWPSGKNPNRPRTVAGVLNRLRRLGLVENPMSTDPTRGGSRVYSVTVAGRHIVDELAQGRAYRGIP